MKIIKNNITELVFILDASGSMHGLEADTLGGFNSMIEKQKKLDGKCYVSTYVFNGTSSVIHDRAPIEKIKAITEKDYTTGGCTALYDAAGEAIEHISMIHKYIRESDIPENVVFVITTDGMENASTKYSALQIKKLIEAKKESGWEFLFLGANIDAISAAADIGIDSDRAANYTCNAEGTQNNYRVLNEAVASIRSARPISSNWKKNIK